MNFFKTCKNTKGQATIEFILSFIIALGFLLAFYKIALLFTNGYLVHYATFQASRAYMVAESNANEPGPSDDFGLVQAKKVFDYYNLPGLVPGFDSEIQFNEPQANLGNETNLYVGAKVRYASDLLVPVAGARIDIPMATESFLGMEPNRAECFSEICAAFADMGAACQHHTTVTDNGC